MCAVAFGLEIAKKPALGFALSDYSFLVIGECNVNAQGPSFIDFPS